MTTLIDVRLVAITFAAQETHLFEFTPLAGGQLPPAEPGAHVDVHLPNGMMRQYSLTKSERAPKSYTFGIKRDPESRGGSRYIFDTLKVGDVVTVRYTESVIVQVRPNAKPTPAQDTTQEARKAGDETVLEQQKIIVTIDNIDSQRLFVTYRTHDNQRVVHAVRDKALLDGIRTGDRVEITLTRARAVSIEPRR